VTFVKIYQLIETVKDNKTYIFLYNIFMAVLALLAVGIVLIDYLITPTHSTLSIFNIIDDSISIIFLTDYLIRLYLSKNRKIFFKSNLIDLVSSIPFNSLFQAIKILKIARLLKFTKLFKLFKVFRIFILLGKFKKSINSFIKTNNFNYVVFITVFTVLLGAFGLSLTEHKTFSDSLWWSFVTVTTVGYGDISPASKIGRLIASVLMLVGIGFIGMLTGTISTFFINRNIKNSSFKEKTLENIKSELDNFDNLSCEDIENICLTLKALKDK
jgi:voltage-gated potassium channel